MNLKNIKELVRVANSLNQKKLYKLADEVDEIVQDENVIDALNSEEAEREEYSLLKQIVEGELEDDSMSFELAPGDEELVFLGSPKGTIRDMIKEIFLKANFDGSVLLRVYGHGRVPRSFSFKVNNISMFNKALEQCWNNF